MNRSTWAVVGFGLLAALLVAFLVAPHASSSPDGLERVAADQRLDTEVVDSPTAGSPLADYQVSGIGHSGVSVGTAGAIGIVATFALTMGVSAVATSRRRRAGT